MSPPKPPSGQDLVAAIRRIGISRRLFPEPRAFRGMWEAQMDVEDVCEVLKECKVDELRKSAPTKNPKYKDWIALFEIELDIGPYYVKLAVALPDMETAALVSFHPWSDERDEDRD